MIARCTGIAVAAVIRLLRPNLSQALIIPPWHKDIYVIIPGNKAFIAQRAYAAASAEIKKQPIFIADIFKIQQHFQGFQLYFSQILRFNFHIGYFSLHFCRPPYNSTCPYIFYSCDPYLSFQTHDGRFAFLWAAGSYNPRKPCADMYHIL